MPKAHAPAPPITFLVPGQRVAGPVTRGGDFAPETRQQTPGMVKGSVKVGYRRGAGDEQRLVAQPGEDVVVLHIAGGPSLVLHPETARDLMLAQSAQQHESRSGKGNIGQEAPPDEVVVPPQLRWRGLEDTCASTRGAKRGFFGDALLAVVEVITGPFKDKVQDFTAEQIAQALDNQITEGVYALNAEKLENLKDSARLAHLPVSDDGAPVLVFIHGTFTDTQGSFGKLWQYHPQRVRELFKVYRGRVYALDHATLAKSPIDNALTLVDACPRGARLHLVTHSRGGLVAEVLARASNLTDLDDAARCLFGGDNASDAPSNEKVGGQRKIEIAQLAALGELIRKLNERKISIERIVRVACPARGTLLASKRFDAYLSVFKWGLELAQIPVLPGFIDFVAGVAQRRADPTRFPGLAAMIPDSPLVQWLHAAETPISGELRVIAGDLEGDSVASWLKTLMADAFFWTDNDLVVQTRSMYGGAPRAADASFVLDCGGEVNHFNYFTNDRTAEAVVTGLTQSSSDWRRIGPLSYAGTASDGVRAATRRSSDDGLSPSSKPAVFVLPGILGSHLKVNGKRIWLGFRLINGLNRLAYPDKSDHRIEPDGAVGMIYDALEEFLAKTHEVIEFSFDWRKPIEVEARRLGREIEAALIAREESNQPVRMVAHSMGGLVARTMQMECKAIWDRMMSHRDARLLMLGTPNDGSWAPMQVLSGDDTFGNALVAFGAPFQDHKARELMAQFPGFIQLQASLVDDSRALHKAETWARLAKDDLDRVRKYNWWHRDELQLTPYTWGIPMQSVLDQAVELRSRLNEQRDKDLVNYPNKVVMVVGRAKFTPDGYELGPDGLDYLNAPQIGDGRVTLRSAMLPGVPTWTLDCDHGNLPDERGAYEAYLDLLQSGTTARLHVQTPLLFSGAAGEGGTGAHVRSRPARDWSSPRPPYDSDEIRSLPFSTTSHAVKSAGSQLRLTVINGDLSFVRQPLMVGHYASNNITGAERVVDRLIGGTMRESLEMGQYPDDPGTHQLFANTGSDRNNPLQPPRPEFVLVLGLGEEGKLKSGKLAYTIKMGVLALAQRLVEQVNGPPLDFELATTLMGSGGTGISAGQSAQIIAQGVREADEALRELNDRLNEKSDRRWPRVGHTYLIELYLDRASEAWRALQLLVQASPGHFQLSDTVQLGQGELKRPLDGGYRGSEYDYIRAISAGGDADSGGIEYTLDTKRARAEVRAQSTQLKLVRELVAKASNDQNADPQIGHTLFHLLVPREIEPFLGGSSEMLLELDRGTAGIPWEMLDTSSGGQGGDSRPWAIRAKLLRKLRIADGRHDVADAGSADHVLVIGEPECDRTLYPRLAGARAEARSVRDELSAPHALGSERVVALISSDDVSRRGPEALDVINALMSKPWRIVHIAGHGEPPEHLTSDCLIPARPNVNPRGVVLSNGTHLGPCEIATLRVVPELVFVNCCHLAGRSIGQLLTSDNRLSYDRSNFASSVAEELIKIGVRCVVAAGWAVDDKPAQTFATTFYEALLRGARFIDAVARAREATHAKGGNTWAAYQCYGDPEWVFRRDGADAQRPNRLPGDEFSGVASQQALILALDTLKVRSQFQRATPDGQRARIRHLESRFKAIWGGVGAVAEAFAAAWDAAGERSYAISWYEKALAASDGSASFRASEQLANLRVKLAWNQVDQVCSARRQLEALNANTKASMVAQGTALAETKDVRDKVINSANETLGQAITLLEGLVALQPTLERLSLLGSAYKRRAMIEREQVPIGNVLNSLQKMIECYERAVDVGQSSCPDNVFYPALNLVAAQCAMEVCQGKGIKLSAHLVTTLRQVLMDKARDDPDFWSVAGLIELCVYEALSLGTLGEDSPTILAAYKDLHTRIPDQSRWGSVLDQMWFVLHGSLFSGSGRQKEREAALELLDQVRAFVEQEM